MGPAHAARGDHAGPRRRGAGREDSLCRHLGHARLSNAHAAEPTTRIDPATLTEHQRTVAASVQAVAGELGVTPAQVAIAWTRTWSPAIHPIIGARRPGQLLDNLGAADLDLTDEAVARLDSVSRLDLGFPATFISDTGPWVFGAAAL